MNYRHHYHAGNFADVFKHALLLPLIRGLQKKEKGFLYLDTHAGRGSYVLEDTTTLPDGRERPPEWPDGIGRIWAEKSGPLQDYLALVRNFNRERAGSDERPQHYPGSPRVAAALMRPVDRMVLCELREEEAEALQADFCFIPEATVQASDGYTAVKALLPPPERRALVLIDPPFESASEFTDLFAGLRDGLRRLPAGVFVVWYPITERAQLEQFFRDLAAMALPPTLVAEFRVTGYSSAVRMKGCGLLVINPPWQVDKEMRPILSALVAGLGRDSGAAGEITWLVPER